MTVAQLASPMRYTRRMCARPLLIDFYCEPGGAAMGYHRAGFEVVGVDHAPQPHYPFDVIVGDVLELGAALLLNRKVAAVHASPPCQAYSTATEWRGSWTDHPDLLAPTRDLLAASGRPWVIENVPGAPMRADYLLCGTMFGLRIVRHRLFETSWHGFDMAPPCDHRSVLPFIHKGERAYADAMGCTWMSSVAARQAIPPAYTEHIGGHLLTAVQAKAA